MYMRMVQAKAQPGTLPQVRDLYEEKIIPTLGAMAGCLHVSLLESTSHPDEFISLTLWRQRRHADDYEASGVFSKFAEGLLPYAAGSSEYALHLGADLTLQYDPVPEEPVIKAFDVPGQSPSAIMPRDPAQSVYLRIVTPQVREGMMEEFKKTFTAEVLPALRAVPGCLQAQLVENVKQKNQVMSLTIWHTKQDAEQYAQSGQFTELTRKVDHCFTELYQMKQQLGKETRGHIVTSEDMSVEGYKVIVSKNFM